jgi:bla regulator protein BlaR1
MNFAQTAVSLLDWGWRASWQASVLVGLVLLVQALLRSKLTPRWRATLWWLVLIRLLMPVVPHTSWSLFNYTRLDRERTAAAPFVSHAVSPRGQEGPASAITRPFPPDSENPSRQPSTASSALGSAQPALAGTARAPMRSGPPWDWRHGLAALWLSGVLLFLGRVAWAYGAFARRLRHLPIIQDRAVVELFDG